MPALVQEAKSSPRGGRIKDLSTVFRHRLDGERDGAVLLFVTARKPEPVSSGWREGWKPGASGGI